MNPLPATPFHLEPRWKHSADLRYLAYKALLVPLWRKVTRPWRYPACRWPVKPRPEVEALYRSGELRPSVCLHELTYEQARTVWRTVLR